MPAGHVDEGRRVGASRRIGTKLVQRLLAVVLLPLVALGGVALFAVRSISDDTRTQVGSARSSLADGVVSSSLEEDARRLISDVENFVGERLAESTLFAEHDLIVDAAIDGAAEAEAQGLGGLGPEELESRFVSTHSLDVSTEANGLLLHRVDDSAFVAAYTATDLAGHTVAGSATPNRFFLGGDDTWVRAVDGGVGISSIAFDAASNRFTIDVDVPIRDGSHTVVGVLRSSIDVSYLQDLASSYAAGSGADVTILNTDGRLLAESATGHDLARIMNGELVLDPVVDAEVVAVRGLTAVSDSLRTDDSVVGFARSTESAIGTALGLEVVVAQEEATALQPLAGLDELHDDVSGASSQLTYLILAIVVGAAIAAAVVARVLVRNILQPIEVLRDHANRVASVELPRVVSEIDALDEGAELPSLNRVSIDTGDEVEELANAFISVQDTAVRLAVEQAAARRRNVASAFVSMGRRNQNLIGRQLKFIEELEQNESDPKTLANLFKLDHLATRLRRNAESLLVLAGEEPPRRFGQAVSIVDVVRSAAAEIEEFERVELSRMDDQPIHGAVVSEMAHLLAELIENALVFSPPNRRVLLAGRVRNEAYELAIVDEGIGMTARELEEANHLLANPVDFDRAPSQRVGLFVVGRLAKRHGIRVKLLPSTSGEGVTALLLIPSSVLAPRDERSATQRPAMDAGPVAPPAAHAPSPPAHDFLHPVEANEPGSAPSSVAPAVTSRSEFNPGQVDHAPARPAYSSDAFAPPAPATEPTVTGRPPSMAEPNPTRSGVSPVLPRIDAAALARPGLPRRDGPGVDPSDAVGTPHIIAAAPPTFAPTAPTAPPSPTVPAGAGTPPPARTERPTLPTRTPGGTLSEPQVTPSGLRRRQTADMGTLVPGGRTAGVDGDRIRDPDEVRATLRRFMTGVGHGRRFAVEPAERAENVAETHAGGARDE